MVRAPANLDADDVAVALTAFVNANIMASSRPIEPDDDFAAAGVDSLGLLKVLLFIESEFGLWIPDEDLVEGNVVSPRAMANYLCRQRNAS